MVQKIIIDYRQLTDGAFSTKVQCIINALTGNPDFTNPIPTLADMQAALDFFDNSILAAADGSRPNIIIRNQARKALAGLVRQLGMYVMFIGNGDATILAGSGYDLAKAPSSQNLATPGAVLIKEGVSTGMLEVSIAKPTGAKSYLHEITADPITPESTWQSVPGTSVKYTFENLTAGKKYWARVAAIGKKAEIAYSDLQLSRFVQ